MNFIKHIGKVGDRKVAIIFRQVPGEEHMCLVVYTEIINVAIHDDLMRAIESKEAQSTDDLSEVLNRTMTSSTGQVLLHVLHNQGFIKKIQTEQVFITPTPKSKMRLSELNDMLQQMSQGEAAIEKLKEMDESRGMQMPEDVRRRRETILAEREQQRSQNKLNNTAKNQPQQQVQPLQAVGQGALGDDAIAASLESQANRMLAEARGLMAEAERMQREVAEMRGVVPVAESKTVKPKRERTKKVKQEV